MELDNRAKYFNVRAYSLHPGSIGGTELGRNADQEQWKKLGFLDENGNTRPAIIASLKTIPQGATTTIFAANSPLLNLIGGVYHEDNDIAALLPTILPSRRKRNYISLHVLENESLEINHVFNLSSYENS